MGFKIYFKHNLDFKINSNQRNGISFLKITKQNFLHTKKLIQKSIDTFNSEIQWDGMWDCNDAEIRLNKNQILYLLLETQTPIGHVWYDSNYTYNAYVSKKRVDGDSIWFIQETMWDMKEKNNLNFIKLYVDSWNIQSIKFVKKLGFVKLD